MQSTLIFVAGLFAAAGSDQGNISQHLVPYEKRFYGQGNISPHSVPFKKRSDWGHISPHCVFFKISFQTSEIDWGNISPHLMSFKKVLWLLKLSSIKFYSFSLFLRGPIKSLHQLLFFLHEKQVFLSMSKLYKEKFENSSLQLCKSLLITLKPPRGWFDTSDKKKKSCVTFLSDTELIFSRWQETVV